MIARRAVVALLLALGLAMTGLFSGAAPAFAHAVLVGSDPGYGAMAEHAPERVSITFDEPVTVAQHAVTVTDRDGGRADSDLIESADGGRKVLVPLRPGLPNGTYLLGWSLLSADGHVVAGSIVFGIGVPPDLTVTAPPPDPLIAMLDTVVRLLTGLGYLGIALAVGVSITVRTIWPDAAGTRGITQLIRVGAVLTAVAALAAFAALPGRLGGAAGWAEPRVWTQSATSLTGVTLLARAVGAIMLAVAATAHTRGAGAAGAVDSSGWTGRGLSGARRVAVSGPTAVAAGAVVVLATALSGHTMAGEYRWAAVLSAALHVIAMAVWVGGVVVVGLSWRTPDRADVVGRFGSVAAGAIGVLMVSGVFQSWRAVSPLAALWSTSWGRLLLLKVALAVLAVVAALVVRRVAASRRTGRAVWAELAAQVSVLVVTALLTGVAPARDTYDPAVDMTASVGPLTARVNIDGTHTGRQEITVRLRDSAGPAVDVLEVTGRLERADGGIGPVEVTFRRVEPIELGPDYFVSQPVRVPIAGEWRLRLTVVADRTNGYAATVPYRVW